MPSDEIMREVKEVLRQIGTTGSRAKALAQIIKDAMQSKWTRVEGVSEMPIGNWEVYLAEDHQKSRFHTAWIHENLKLVAGLFHFDVPTVTHYRPLPPPPQEDR